MKFQRQMERSEMFLSEVLSDPPGSSKELKNACQRSSWIKQRQKKLHPDLVHSKSEKEKEFAAAQSARVIDAYHTLSKPLSRALYMLQLDGINIDEEQTITDPDLLAEMMDLRESVEEASSSQALNQIESQIQSKIESWSNSFREAYKKQNYDAAIAATQRMRYYERAVEEILKKS